MRDRCNLDAATKDFETAINREPDVASHWANRAAIRVEQCNPHSRPRRTPTHALWLDPENADALTPVRGIILSDQSHAERARADIEQAYLLVPRELSLRPRRHLDFTTMVAKFSLHCMTSIPVKFERLVGKSFACRLQAFKLEFRTNCILSWWSLGMVEFHRKDFALAEQHFSRSLELNPQDAWSACLVGLTRYELGRSEEAIRDLERAISLNSQFGYAYRSRGFVLNARNDHQGAIADLTRAL